MVLFLCIWGRVSDCLVLFMGILVYVGNCEFCEDCILRLFISFCFLGFKFCFSSFPSPLSTCALDVLMADRRIPDFAKTLTVSTPPFPWNFPGRVGQQWPSCTESRRATTTPLKILVTVIPISVRRIKQKLSSPNQFKIKWLIWIKI